MPPPDKCYCGSECYKKDDDPNEPCWGELNVWEEYDAYIHFCDGHPYEEEYILEPE